jgi:hypothetical protein
MGRIRLTAVASGLLVGVLMAATVLTLTARDSPSATDAVILTPAGAKNAEHGESGGLGPPPWAHAGGNSRAQRGKAAQSWKGDWRAMTPAQKARKMDSLARAHEEGMRSWARCVRGAGTDPVQRRACAKPLPPGLAKKQR